jgi:hypothetical protein
MSVGRSAGRRNESKLLPEQWFVPLAAVCIFSIA